jgi:hypothetical protein
VFAQLAERPPQDLATLNQTKEQKDMPCSLCSQKFGNNKTKLHHWREFRCAKLKVKAVAQRSQPEAGDAANVTVGASSASEQLDFTGLGIKDIVRMI